MAKELSVQDIVRQELLHKDIDDNCEYSFLSAVIRGTGEINISKEGFSLNIIHESKELIKVCNEIIRQRYHIDGIIEQSSKNIGMRQIRVYRACYGTHIAPMVLSDCFIISDYKLIKGIDNSLIDDTAKSRAYLRGIFLSCGYLSTPKDIDAINYEGKKGYHLELILNSDLIKTDLAELVVNLCSFNLDAIKTRRSASSLYIKSAQNISDFLAAMQANQGVMVLQQIMTNRAMRNHLNRGNNAILANIDKSIIASEKQRLAIEIIENNIGIESLDKRLQETIELRRKYPNATLGELAELSNNTKSKIYHRLRKIQEIAKNIKEM